MYLGNVEKIQKSKFELNIYAAIVCYLIISLYLIFLIYYKISLKKCVIISFFIYAIYNLTNLSTFNDYSVNLAIIDICWGCFVTFFTIYIVNKYEFISNIAKIQEA